MNIITAPLIILAGLWGLVICALILLGIIVFIISFFGEVAKRVLR